MILIIDAYNVLKYRVGHSTVSQQERTHFIHELQGFSQKKNIQPLLVFDAGPHRWPYHETHGTIQIVYAGSGQTADDYIKHYIAQNATKDLLLISSDNDLCSYANQEGVVSLDAQSFSALMQRQAHTKHESRKKAQSMRIIKLTSHDNPEVDALMRQTVEPPISEEEVLDLLPDSKRSSKTDRKLLAKLKKLL